MAPSLPPAEPAPAPGPCATGRSERVNHQTRPARLVRERLMKIKLERLLFLLGVGLLVIGVGVSIVVIAEGLVDLVRSMLS
jgi:hypothetical protein